MLRLISNIQSIHTRPYWCPCRVVIQRGIVVGDENRYNRRITKHDFVIVTNFSMSLEFCVVGDCFLKEIAKAVSWIDCERMDISGYALIYTLS